jgi:hypothetical protein
LKHDGFNPKKLGNDDIKINNLALKDEVCCSGKVLDSGLNTQEYALKGGVLNPSLTIKNGIWKTIMNQLLLYLKEEN